METVINLYFSHKILISENLIVDISQNLDKNIKTIK